MVHIQNHDKNLYNAFFLEIYQERNDITQTWNKSNKGKKEPTPKGSSMALMSLIIFLIFQIL